MRKFRRILVFLPFLFLAVLVVLAPSSAVRSIQIAGTAAAWPFLKLSSLAQAKIHETIRFWTDQQILIQQKNTLEERLQEVACTQVALSELRNENLRLKKLLDFRQVRCPDAVAARVFGYDPSGWTQAVLVDKGSVDHVTANRAVVCPGGVVGRVDQVGSFASKILLLVDSRIRIGAMLENSRDMGILVGAGPRRCRLLYLPRETKIAVGQKVLTSGLGGIFPKGILIGKVSGSGMDELALYQYADVEPAVCVSKLEEVLILKTEPLLDKE